MAATQSQGLDKVRCIICRHAENMEFPVSDVTKPAIARRLIRLSVALSLSSCLLLSACTSGPSPSEGRPTAGLTAAEFGSLVARADAVVEARLVSVTMGGGPDNMDGTMHWHVVASHRGSVPKGSHITTRFKAPFSTSGSFCTGTLACSNREALASYAGETFFVSLSRSGYEAQARNGGGTPSPGHYSLVYGYYLIQGDGLYTNDVHRPPLFTYSQARSLVTSQR